jgi:hypothetical protein
LIPSERNTSSKAADELAVAIADQDARPLLRIGQRHEQVARLLRDPGAVWVGGDACEVDATPPHSMKKNT